eukprot:scaffold801_cov178-Ochromonas_danica.AAC.11
MATKLLEKGTSLLEVSGVLAATYTLYQSHKYHKTGLQKARERHAQEIALAKEQHMKSLAEAKRCYLLELLYDLEQHFQQLNADLIASGNESERDMFDQRNQSFQTMILASSVMFTGLSTAIVNGSLPQGTSEWLIIALSIVAALSFFFLFGCVVICVELVIRASNFMYRRAKRHANNLKRAIIETRSLMQQLNMQEGQEMREPDKHRIITKMDEKALNAEWKAHESKLQCFLDQRENINDLIAVVDHVNPSEPRDAKKMISFQDFWKQSCSFWNHVAVIFFFLGTGCLLLCIMIFMWADFSSNQMYNDQAGAIISVVLIGSSLAIGIVFAAIISINRSSREEIQQTQLVNESMQGLPE